jgi:hypothetical protein
VNVWAFKGADDTVIRVESVSIQQDHNRKKSYSMILTSQIMLVI